MTDLMFRLLGDSSGAEGALAAIEGKGSGVAGKVSAAFAGMAIGSAFNNSMEEGQVEATFKAQIGGLPEDAEASAKQAGDLYRNGWGSSLGDVTGAMKAVQDHLGDLGAMGPDQVDKITKGALSLSTAFGLNVNDSMSAVSLMMKNNMAPDAQSAMDIITAGMQDGANASGDFVSTLTTYGPTFQKMGIDGATASAMISSGLKAGAPSADAAMKGFQTFAAAISTGSPTTSKILQGLGIDSKDVADKMAAGGPAAKDAMGTVLSALQGVTDPQQQAADGAALFGKSWKKSGDDALFAMNPVTQATTDVTDATEKMGDTMHDTAQTKVDTMKRQFEGFMMDMVSAPGPIGTVGTFIAGMGPQGIEMAGSLISAGAALKDIGIIGKITGAAEVLWRGAVAVATGVATAAQWLWNVAMDANPIGLIILAVVAFVAVIILLWNNCSWFRDFFLGAWEMIKEAIGKVGDFFVAIWNWVWAACSAVVQWITSAWQTFKDWISAAISAIGGFFSGLWDWVTSTAGAAVDWVTSKWQAFKDWISDGLKAIGSWFSGLWDSVNSAASGAVDWAKGVWQGFSDWIGGVLGGIGNFFSGMWTGVKDGVTSVGQWIQDKFQAAVNFVTGIFGGIGQALQGAFNGIAEFMKKPINVAIDAINWCIDQLNKVSFSVPSWVPGIGGNSFGVNISHIPHLAEGGIVSSPTIALIGEGGESEAVVPLSKMGSMGGGGGTTVHIHLPAGAIVGTADQMATLVVDSIKGAQRRGSLPSTLSFA